VFPRWSRIRFHLKSDFYYWTTGRFSKIPEKCRQPICIQLYIHFYLFLNTSISIFSLIHPFHLFLNTFISICSLIHPFPSFPLYMSIYLRNANFRTSVLETAAPAFLLARTKFNLCQERPNSAKRDLISSRKRPAGVKIDLVVLKRDLISCRKRPDSVNGVKRDLILSKEI
jgi:hypothetical protein